MLDVIHFPFSMIEWAKLNHSLRRAVNTLQDTENNLQLTLDGLRRIEPDCGVTRTHTLLTAEERSWRLELKRDETRKEASDILSSMMKIIDFEVQEQDLLKPLRTASAAELLSSQHNVHYRSHRLNQQLTELQFVMAQLESYSVHI